MLDARQLAEVYAFAKIEPLDEPLQRMLAEIAAVLARVHGNKLTPEDFMLSPPARLPEDDKAARSSQLAQMFASASKANETVARGVPRRRIRKQD